MAGGLFFCATLTGRRGGHTPFVRAGSETSDTGRLYKQEKKRPTQLTYAVLGSHSRSVGADVGDESTKPLSVVQPLRLRIPS